MRIKRESHRGLLLPALAATMAAIFFGCAISFEKASANLGLSDPVADYLTGVVWAFCILAFITALPLASSTKRALLVLWIVRVGVALGFMLLYEGYYGLDADHYWFAGGQNYDHWADTGFGKGTANMIALSALHQWLIPGSYHAMKLTCSAIGLTAIYLFYRCACLFLNREDTTILLALGLFPSILFWSSILGKDPVTLLGIGAFCLGVVGFYKTKQPAYLFLTFFGLITAGWIRVWLVLIFIIPLGIFFFIGKGGLARRIVFICVMVPGLLLSMNLFQARFQIDTTQDIVERTDQLSQSWSRGGAVQQVQGFGSVSDMVRFLPVGIFTALFRPLPGEILNPFGILASLENFLVICLLARALWSGTVRRLRDPLLMWAACTVLTWASIYGFVSYQNLGTAFRFRAQVMPILLLICLALSAKDSYFSSYKWSHAKSRHARATPRPAV